MKPLLIFFCLVCHPGWGTTYFVAPGGNDGNNGKSSTAAWLTLQKAANSITSGDSVLVADGNYVGFDFRTSGTVNDPIVFKATGQNVVITTRNAVTPDGINIENANWVEIYGFRVINQPRAGIRAVLADHITVRYNKCLNNQRWGIFTGFTDDFLAEYNECSGAVLEHGIYVSNSSDRAIVRFNSSHDNNAAGLHFNGDLSQGEDGINHDTQVYGNIIYKNGAGGGAAINLDGNQNALVYNNLIYDNRATGITLFQGDGGSASTGARIYHNTIIQPSNGRYALLIFNGSINATVKNNIFINQHSFRGSITIDPASRPGLVCDYNIMTNRFTLDDGTTVIDSTAWKSLGYDVHSFFSPNLSNLFLNYPTGNLMLKPDGKAVNFGTSLTPVISVDYGGRGRPFGAAPDAGAYEMVPVEGPNPPVPPSLNPKITRSSIKKELKTIEVTGLFENIKPATSIKLVKLNARTKKLDSLQSKTFGEKHDLVTIRFKHTHTGIGKQDYQLILTDTLGHRIASPVMTIEIDQQEIHFYPNPVQNVLKIEYKNSYKNPSLIVEDIMGKQIKSLPSLPAEIDLTNLMPGQYLITILDGQERVKSTWIEKY